MVEVVKYSATGRRKCSVARVNIAPGKGKIEVNNRPLNEYFPREVHQGTVMEPLTIANMLNKFDVSANVVGGGETGQAGAIKLGLSRALVLCDGAVKPLLKKADCLRRNPRMKERKKPGQKGARKRFQWVKR